MATPKPQIRNLFATPVCQHFLPIALEANAALRPMILERFQAGASAETELSWRSSPDLTNWGGAHAETLFRVLRELADGLTATRAGARVNVDWKVVAFATVRRRGSAIESVPTQNAFWSGVYYVDDGYQNSDDEKLGGDCELADPRGPRCAEIAPHLAFRIPGGLSVGQSETIRPKSGMILLHPSWMSRRESQFEGPSPRVAIEFDLAVS